MSSGIRLLVLFRKVMVLLRRSARYGGALQFKLTDILIGARLSSGMDIEAANGSPTGTTAGHAITRCVAYGGFVSEQGDQYR
jgi:hypothetical protein